MRLNNTAWVASKRLKITLIDTFCTGIPQLFRNVFRSLNGVIRCFLKSLRELHKFLCSRKIYTPI